MHECPICNGTGRTVRRIHKRGPQLERCRACGANGFVEDATAEELGRVLRHEVEEKEAPMEKHNTALRAFQKVGKKAGQAITNTAQRKLATATCNKLCDLGVEAFGERIPFLATPAGQKSLKAGLPVMLMLGCALLEDVEANPIPGHIMAGLSAAGELAFEGVTEETIEEVADLAMPFLTQIAQLGWASMQLQAAETEKLSATVDNA